MRRTRRVHSVVLCDCPRDALCDKCRESLFTQLRGTAARRGDEWADRVKRAEPRRREWPPHEGADAELARGLVRDLTRDPQLLNLLAAELARWAAKRWSGVVVGDDAQVPR